MEKIFKVVLFICKLPFLLVCWLFSDYDETHEKDLNRGEVALKKEAEQEEIPSDVRTVYFIYKKECGEISTRIGKKAYRFKWRGMDYINTFSGDKRKDFKVSRIVQMFSTLEELENAPIENKEVVRNNGLLAVLPEFKRKGSENKFDVCFTGFVKEEKKELMKLAKCAGVTIRSSVVVGLNILCCGSKKIKSGKKKIQQAETQGTKIINEAEFKTFLETGELGEAK